MNRKHQRNIDMDRIDEVLNAPELYLRECKHNLKGLMILDAYRLSKEKID